MQGSKGHLMKQKCRFWRSASELGTSRCCLWKLRVECCGPGQDAPRGLTWHCRPSWRTR